MMKIELTDQQEQQVQQGNPVEVVDPRTQRSYLLVAPEQLARMHEVRPEPLPGIGVAPGIRASQEAYWKDLPTLLALKSESREWVAYCGNQQIGFARTMAELYEECNRRGLKATDFYVDRLEPRALPPWEEEVIEADFDIDELSSPEK